MVTITDICYCNHLFDCLCCYITKIGKYQNLPNCLALKNSQNQMNFCASWLQFKK